MAKLVINMALLFGALLVAWELQDNGQPIIAAALLILALKLAFIFQVGKAAK